MALSDLTVTVTVKQRPLLSRLCRLPFVFVGHYRTMRRYQRNPLVCAYGAWVLAGALITFGPVKE